MQDPDGVEAESVVVAAPLFGLVEGDGGALDLKDEVFFFPGDVGDAVDGGKGALDAAALQAPAEEELEAEVDKTFFVLAAEGLGLEMVKMGLAVGAFAES